MRTEIVLMGKGQDVGQNPFIYAVERHIITCTATLLSFISRLQMQFVEGSISHRIPSGEVLHSGQHVAVLMTAALREQGDGQ